MNLREHLMMMILKVRQGQIRGKIKINLMRKIKLWRRRRRDQLVRSHHSRLDGITLHFSASLGIL